MTETITVSPEQARALVAGLRPDLANLLMTPVVSSGTDNTLFRVGEDLCARFPRVEWAANSAPREYAVLQRISVADSAMAVPEPLALGEPGHGYPWQWTLLGWLEGEAGTGCSLVAEDAERLARFLKVLRSLPAEPHFASGPKNHFRGVPLAERAEPTEAALHALADTYDHARLARLWRDCLAADDTHTPVWLHGDLHGGNVLLGDGQLSAVIDWGLAGVGDGACDLAAAWTLFEAPARDAFRSALSPTQAEWMRGAGWALSTAAIFLAYYRDKGVETTGSRRTLARLLEAFA
ncbi:MAG: aminoglycoside phosphotransferase family protein [Pseudomonadota bacterium]